MPTLAALSRLDWVLIRRRALDAGAAVLAEAVRQRASGTATTVRQTNIAGGHTHVQLHDPALIRRELGNPGWPPAPVFAPGHADRVAMRAAIIESLRKDLP